MLQRRWGRSECLDGVLTTRSPTAGIAITSAILERNGCEVVATGIGQCALALSRRHKDRIDLLLTDVIMPTMQGTALADA